MKLFVDDIRNAPDESWVVARTVTEAIRILDTQEVEEVSLDHDISHQVTVGDLGRPYPCAETFEPVVRFLASSYTTHPDVTIVIHTANPVGAQKMREILEHANVYSITVRPYAPVNRLEMEKV